MNDTLNYSPFQILTNKDISNIIGMSEATAKRYASDIKLNYNITKITYAHLKDYLKIP